jgi:trk system potassium uptake protein TrkA
LKNGEMVKPTGGLRIEDGDILAIFALAKDVPELERLLQVSIDFF